jgi:hypothetical protein
LGSSNTPDAFASSSGPSVTVVEFTDPTEAGQGFDLAAFDAVQLQSSPMRVRRVLVRLGDAHVAYHASNVRLRTRGRMEDVNNIAPRAADHNPARMRCLTS